MAIMGGIGALIFVLATVAMIAASMLRTYPVVVVNGLNTGYVVEINGQEVALGQEQWKKIHLRRGSVRYEVKEPSLAIPSETFDFDPRSGQPHLIINPDGVAVLQYDAEIYTARGRPSMQRTLPPKKILLGQTHYQLANLDLYFEPFPKESKGTEDQWLLWRITHVGRTKWISNSQAHPAIRWLTSLGSINQLSEAERSQLARRFVEIQPGLPRSLPDRLSFELVPTGLAPYLPQWGYTKGVPGAGTGAHDWIRTAQQQGRHPQNRR